VAVVGSLLVATGSPLLTAGSSLAAAGSPLLAAALIERPILAVVYAITVGVSVWLFRDARRRGQSVLVAAGWAVGGVVLPGIVHFVYLYRRTGSMTTAADAESPVDDES